MKTEPVDFWSEAIALRNSVTPLVLPRVCAFGLVATAVWVAAWYAESHSSYRIGLEVAPHEIAGAVLALLLILRTNAGYDRWWEARRLWGSIVNQSRNLAISALAYGPSDRQWRKDMIAWTTAYSYAARASLRGEPFPSEVAALVGAEEAERLAGAEHSPSYVACKLAELLRQGRESGGMDGLMLLQIDRERSALIDHVGGCERILKTPLPRVYAIKIRRFLSMFLITLPFALLHRIELDWLVPVVTMFVAYPMLALDQIGAELQNPFSTNRLSHLPLDTITATIARNLDALLNERQRESGGVSLTQPAA